MFMGFAELASRRSKDPDTRCGAVIVNPETPSVVSVGYNGLPRGLDDDGWDIRFEDEPELPPNNGVTYDYWKKPDKYEFSVHAEENAILNSPSNRMSGFHIYVYCDKGYYPCSRCARDIVQVGIKEVIMPFAITDNTNVYNWSFTKHMFKKAGVHIRVLGEKK